MESTIMGYIGYRLWGIWGSYSNIPKPIFYLLQGDNNHATRASTRSPSFKDPNNKDTVRGTFLGGYGDCIETCGVQDFPKLWAFWGISIISMIIIWGLYWGPLVMETIKCAQALAQMKGKPKMFGSSDRVVAATAIIQHRGPPLSFGNKAV